MPRRWELTVDSAMPDGDRGVFLTGTDRGALPVQGDLVVVGEGRYPVHIVASGDQAQFYARQLPADAVSPGDRLVGGGDSTPDGVRRWGAEPGEVEAAIADPAALEEWTWDVALASAVRGSSGRWTASLFYVPISVGGATSEAEAFAGLRSRLHDELSGADRREQAIRVLRRSQAGGEP